MNELFTEFETAEILKISLDKHLKSIGKISSMLELDISQIPNFEKLNFEILKEECLKQNIYIDFIANSKYKKHFPKSYLYKRILISYTKIPV